MSLTESIVFDAIQLDMHYVGRVVNSLKNADGDTGIGAMFSMFPYFSLFIYESRNQLKKINPNAYNAIPFSSSASDQSAKSRHSLKLFEDNKRGIEGQLTYFESIDTAHSDFFIGSVKLPFASRWKTDLSVSYYDERIISTSHSATFGMGIELNDLFGENMKKKIRAVSQEYGAYLGAWGITTTYTESFVSHMISEKYKAKDRRSKDFYVNSFNGNATPGYNALLTSFLALINSSNTLISLDTSSLKSNQTIFKIKYLTLYQVLRSIELLKSEKQAQLTVESIKHIDKLLAHQTAKLILDQTKKPFRNTLMHYNIDSRIDVTLLSLNSPLYGLCEAVFQVSYNEMSDQIDELLKHSASIFNQWSSFDSKI